MGVRPLNSFENLGQNDLILQLLPWGSVALQGLGAPPAWTQLQDQGLTNTWYRVKVTIHPVFIWHQTKPTGAVGRDTLLTSFSSNGFRLIAAIGDKQVSGQIVIFKLTRTLYIEALNNRISSKPVGKQSHVYLPANVREWEYSLPLSLTVWKLK